MAIYHLHVNIIGRKSGRSSVAAAAYRSGEKILNKYDGVTHDYRRKSDTIHTEIMLPANALRDYKDRSTLWNAVEKAEKRCDAQTARDIDVALPIEFTRKEQIELMREYVQENFVNRGMCADFAIHDKQDGNPHAHIMLTTRHVNETGFAGKNRDWNRVEYLEQWRKNWADTCNKQFKERGLTERIDHRTLEAQGILREPTIHIGVATKALENKGIKTDRMKVYREIVERNELLSPKAKAEYIRELEEGINILDREIRDIRTEIADTQREAELLRIKIREITERSKFIHETRGNLETLQQQRANMGFFTNKKAIDEQIQRTENILRQAEKYLKQGYFIMPEDVNAEIKRLDYKAKDKEGAKVRLIGKLKPFVEGKAVFELEHNRQKALLERVTYPQNSQDKAKQPQHEKRLHRTHNRFSDIEKDRVKKRNFGRSI